MNVHAADLLEQSLEASETAHSLPPADELFDAFEDLLERQQDVYDQIFLPCLGLGERFDLRSQELELDDEAWQFRGGEIWLFDAHPRQSWLQAPLLCPFTDVDDTLTLVHRQDMPAEVAARLRPPLISGVRQALADLDWLVVDTGGYEGGRMKHDEFLDEIGDRAWYRIDHDSKTSAVRFEHWRGDRAQAGWTANVYDAFTCEMDPGSDWDSPVTVGERWPTHPDIQPFETAVALDLLDDPYANLRRLVWHDTLRQDTLRQDTLRQDTLRQDTLRQDTLRQDTLRQDTLRHDILQHDTPLDIDRLGPLVTWKDRPDALFEFNDTEDRLLADVAAWFSFQFDVAQDDHDDVQWLVDDWFERICEMISGSDSTSTPVDLPGIGLLYEITVPAVELDRPPPLMGAEPARSVRLQRQRLFAATAEDADDWYA
jgi:hypothetical protein